MPRLLLLPAAAVLALAPLAARAAEVRAVEPAAAPAGEPALARVAVSPLAPIVPALGASPSLPASGAAQALPAAAAAPRPAARAAVLAAAIRELRDKSFVVVPARQWLPKAAVAELERRMEAAPKNVESFYNEGRVLGKITAPTRASVMRLFAKIERGLNEGLADEGPFQAVNVRAHYAPYLDAADGVAVNTRGKHLDTTKVTVALTLRPDREDAGTVYVDEQGAEHHVRAGDLLLFSGELRPKVQAGLVPALLHGSPDYGGRRLALFAFYNDDGRWHR